MHDRDDEAVVLVVPAQSHQARLCRLVASGVAVSAGLDYEGVADFRIAVDELASTLIETTRHSVSLRFTVEPGAIVVDGRSTGPTRDAPEASRFALSNQILDVVADHYEYGVDQGVPCFRLVKLTGRADTARSRTNEGRRGMAVAYARSGR